MEELNLQSPDIETTNQSPSDTHNQQEAQAKSDAEKNFAALRREKERVEKENREYKQRMLEYEASIKKQALQRDPSDLAELRDLDELRQAAAREREEYRRELAEIRLRTQYSDIDKVLSAENIAKFKESDPDLAQLIAEMPDDNKKAIAAYKYIKKLGICQEDNFTREKEAIASNAQKPRSSSAASKQSPLSEMNNYIEKPDEYRKRLYREMVAAAENR